MQGFKDFEVSERTEPADGGLRIMAYAAAGLTAESCAHRTEDAMTTRMQRTIWMTLVCAALAIAGCKISKQGSGDDKKVSIEAPGASLKVDTGVAANDSGLALYPGAQPKRGTSDDKSRAHVNLNMPFFKLNVVALKFTSDDAPERILAFYRGKLGSYGTVLECKGGGQDVEVGSGRGLDSPVSCGKLHNRSGEISLKVGTEGDQHVVSVKPSGRGSEFSLVHVRLGKSKNDDDYAGKQPS
jgi:hypothetical protein